MKYFFSFFPFIWFLYAELKMVSGLHTQERSLDECFWTPEPLVGDSEHLMIGQVVALKKKDLVMAISCSSPRQHSRASP